jgi:riboflavin synthase
LFTGIIEDLGKVVSIRKEKGVFILAVETKIDLGDLKVGDSISVDGVCLTVVETRKNSFSVEVSSETLSRSTLNNIEAGYRVNLERAMKVGDRLGGHMVSGHVDVVGKIKEIRDGANGLIIEITPPEDFMRYIVDKGSVAVDGISLTVNSIKRSSFTVNIIGHTEKNTTLSTKGQGGSVNLEADIIGKYVEKFLSTEDKREGDITLKKLSEEGYI